MKISTYIIFNILAAVFLSLGLTKNASAQETKHFSLVEVLSLAKEQNWDVLRAEQQLALAKANLKQSNAVFLPVVRLSETYTTTTDPLTAFGIKLKQKTTTVTDFDPGILNDPDRIENFTTALAFQQPVINLSGMMARKAANMAMAASDQQLTWTKRLIELQAKDFYFQLQVAYTRLEVVQQALKAANANFKLTQDYFDNGLVTEADLLGARLRMTELESQVLASENIIQVINRDLLHLLNLQGVRTIIPMDTIRIPRSRVVELQTTSVPLGRPDLQAAMLNTRAGEYEMKSARSSFLPDLNIFGSYEWNDGQVFGTGASGYVFGAKLQWDIFSGGTKLAQHQRAKANQRLSKLYYQETLSKAEKELKKLQDEIILARKQLDLAILAEQQAESSYNIRRDRYEEQLEKTTDLLDAETMLLQRRIQKLEQMRYYQQLVFSLQLQLENETSMLQ
ncbi:TolC family protein [Fulvivirgaceae bacterium BMA10]|uniref:TolC family protein n=1 Tax=Splendidivirga corallicola TaxID=3051826 RepID=A0ABT8KW71_9BACT|nr:TolC family protein [Fulvivirgaceae bacterium BMA10]